MKTKSTKSLPSELKTTQDSASTSTTNTSTSTTTKKKSKKSKKFKTAAKTLLRLTPRKSSPKDATPSSSSSTMTTKKMDSMNSVSSSTVPSSTTAATSSTCQFTFGGGSSSSGLEPFQEPSSSTPMASLSAKSMPRVSNNSVEDASNKFIVPPQSSLFEEVEEEEVVVVPLTAAATPITKNIHNKNRPPQEQEEAVEIVPTSPMAPPPPIKLSEIVASTRGEEDDEDDVSVMTSTSIMTNHTLLTVKEDNNTTSCYNNNNNNNNNKNNSKSNYISSNNNKNLVVTGGNVKVVIRVRPVLSNTMEADSSCCVQVLPPPSDTSENNNNNNKHQALVIQGRNNNNNNNNGSTTDSKTFTFDEIFPPNIHQETIYTSSVLPLIHSSLECGYNATVLAYGQTGSGKTFTMMGENNKTSFLGGGSGKGGKVYKDWGVIPRALNDIFTRLTQRASSSPSSFRYEVTLQSVELYGEEIRDLFSSSNSNSKEKLKVRDVSNTKNNDTEPEVMGATTIAVSSYDEAVRYIQKSMRSRVVASTSMNEVSSRSHAITTVKITQWKKTGATTTDGGGGGEEVMEVRQSKIHLVDLAGSESLKRTQAEGERMKEGIHINKGLTVLGRVISALAKSTPEKQYVIPYRDSKLTHLLRGSLGGNHKTLMIACISPSSLNQEESLRCLRYASRAKYIRNKKAEANVTLEGEGVNKKEMMRMRLRMKEMESELLSQQDKMRAMSMEIQHLKKEEDEETEEEEKKHEEAVATTTTPATVVGHVESDVHGHEYVAVEAKGFALPNNIKQQQTQPTIKDDEMESEQMLAMKRELQSLRAERDTYRRLVEETSVACGTVAEEGESDDIIPPSSSTLTVRTEHLQTPQKMVGLQDERQDDDDDDEGDVVSPLNSPVKIHQKSRSLNSSLDQNSRDEYFYAVPQEYQQPSSQSQHHHQQQQPMQHPCVFNVAPCAGFRSFNSIVDRWFGHSSNSSSGSNNRHHRRSRSSSNNRHHSHNLYSDDNSSVSSAMTTNSIRTTNSTRTAGSARSVRTAASDRSKSSLQAGFLGYGRRY